MIIIIAEEGKKIHLGRVGENEARAVRFDISRIQAEFPGATFSVLNMRPEDPDAYPVNGQYIRIDGNYLYWTLQSGDLTQDALGECELKATLNGVIVKSIIWTTEICPALDGNGTPPEPWESWQQQVEDDADRAEAAAEDSEAWAVGERGGVPVVEGDQTYHNNAEYWAGQAQETLASKADKADTVLTTTLSRGRKSGTTVGTASFAFGYNVTASGAYSRAEGNNVTASGSNAHAEGYYATASGSGAHAEGANTTASDDCAHAEGARTTASNIQAHAEGVNTTASGKYAHSEGNSTTASGECSHSEGQNTVANHKAQHVFGMHNVPDPSTASDAAKGNYVEIVGNGTSSSNKKNARVLDWNGNERLAGDLYVGANTDGTGGTKVAKITDIPDPVDISGKADKVTGATSGNFAGLDAEGNLTDSGSKASDFLTEHQDISGKADKVSGATNNHLAALDGNGNLKDSGKAAADFVEAEDFRADAMPMSATDPTKVSAALTDVKSAISFLGTDSADALKKIDQEDLTLESGYAIANQTTQSVTIGQKYAVSNYGCSGFIQIPFGTEMISTSVRVGSSAVHGWCLYDANFAPIIGGTAYPISISSYPKARYVRVTSYSTLTGRVIAFQSDTNLSDIKAIAEETCEYKIIPPYSRASGYILRDSDGATDTNSNYALIYTYVTPGEKIRVVSNNKFCFRKSGGVIIGPLYGIFDGIITVPTGAFECVIQNPVNGPYTYCYEIIGSLDKIGTTDNIIDEITNEKKSSNLFDGEIISGRYLGTDDKSTASGTHGFTKNFIPVSQGDEIVCGYQNGTASNMRYVTAYDASYTPVPSAGSSTNITKYTVPSGVSFIRISCLLTIFNETYFRINRGGTVLPYEAYGSTYVPKEQLAESISEYVHSANWCNPVDIEENRGKYLKNDGSTGTDSNFSYTGFIPVAVGQKLYALHNSYPGSARFRWIAAYNSSKILMPESGYAITHRVWTIPEGVSFVRVTIYIADYDLGGYSLNVGKQMPYDTYSNTLLPKGVGENATGVELLNKMPIETVPPYVRNILAYRPLTAPTKGYFCFVTDDGHADMVTYTIPMVIEKEIPCTFAVFKASACFSTQEQTAVVVDAVENHGCAISQHGGRNWTEYSEYGLNNFFDDEKVFWDSLGVDVKSAVIPSHYTSTLVQCVAGGRFGVVRSGGKGYDEHGIYGHTIRNWYDYFTSGEGSNLFGLSSYNVTTHTFAENKLAVDYAYDNNKIMIVYIHENSLNDDKKAVLESVIDYAKTKGLEFITLDKIPYLNEGTITM